MITEPRVGPAATTTNDIRRCDGFVRNARCATSLVAEQFGGLETSDQAGRGDGRDEGRHDDEQDEDQDVADGEHADAA